MTRPPSSGPSGRTSAGALETEDLVEDRKEVVPPYGLAAEEVDGAADSRLDGVVKPQVARQYVDDLHQVDAVEIQGHHVGGVRFARVRTEPRRVWRW